MDKFWEDGRERWRSITATFYKDPKKEVDRPQREQQASGVVGFWHSAREYPEVWLTYGVTAIAMGGVWFYLRRRLGIVEARWRQQVNEGAKATTTRSPEPIKTAPVRRQSRARTTPPVTEPETHIPEKIPEKPKTTRRKRGKKG